jgi:hypothetical protein
MHTIKIDIQKNRLYLTLIGVLKIPEAKKIQEEIANSVSKLLPEFDVINDLSKYIQGDDKAAPILQEIAQFLIINKVKRIVRIVGQSKAGLLQFAKYTQKDEAKFIKYVPTIEEAEIFLVSHAESNSE